MAGRIKEWTACSRFKCRAPSGRPPPCKAYYWCRRGVPTWRHEAVQLYLGAEAGNGTAQLVLDRGVAGEDGSAQAFVDHLCTRRCRAARRRPCGGVQVHGAGPRRWPRAAKGPAKRRGAQDWAFSDGAGSSDGTEGREGTARPTGYAPCTDYRIARSTDYRIAPCTDYRIAPCTDFGKKGCLFAPAFLDLGVRLAII